MGEPIKYTNLSIVIVDGFFLLRKMKNIPVKYSLLSESFLRLILDFNSQIIIVVFDQYFSPSIKDNERERRDGYEGKTYKITANMIRPNDFTNELKNSKYKEALVEFFLNDWAKQEMAEYIGSKMLDVSYKNYDTFVVLNGKVEKTRVDESSCPDQEEADTRMVHYACQVSVECEILLKCNDSDILIIMLGNMHNITNKDVKIWIETGTGNNTRHINVNQLYKKLGESVSKALPAFHALTGCDYNPSFFKRGKTAPFHKLQKSLKFQTAFTQLINNDFAPVKKTVFPVLEEFVCHMYNLSKSKKVDKARYDKFAATYVPKRRNEKFQKKLDNFDASNLLPCQVELYQHLCRTFYITNVWSNSYKKKPTDLKPIDCGWKESPDGKKFDFVWFTGKQFPDSIQDIIIQPTENEDASCTYKIY